ncbi:hypothetical protein WJX73_007968 [Symbiochloris irregularis]|uniref:SET domain-containing protein n=1 Tax=Symbiochloris irregularis TaxID=706552 RepID=A0AAW1PCL4_9CHLO
MLQKRRNARSCVPIPPRLYFPHLLPIEAAGVPVQRKFISVEGMTGKACLDVRQTEGRGHHTCGLQRLPPGVTVLKEPVWVFASGSEGSACRTCLDALAPKTMKAPITCSTCQAVLYCSQYCARQDAAAHADSAECCLLHSCISRQALGAFMREACLALRLLHKPLSLALQADDAAWLQADEQDAAMITAAARCMHEASRRQQAAASLPTDPKPPEAADPAQKQKAFSLEAARGIAIYATAARFNHSCRPNAAYHFRKGGRVVVRTLTEVAADEEVTVAYLDCILPFARRQEQLLQRAQKEKSRLHHSAEPPAKSPQLRSCQQAVDCVLQPKSSSELSTKAPDSCCKQMTPTQLAKCYGGHSMLRCKLGCPCIILR